MIGLIMGMVIMAIILFSSTPLVMSIIDLLSGNNKLNNIQVMKNQDIQRQQEKDNQIKKGKQTIKINTKKGK